jgi:hypothetical protein
MLYLFKAFLLLSLVGLGYLLFIRIRVKLFQRIFGFVLVVMLAVFILVPETSTRIAQFFGIGRGVDFVFYAAHVFWAYIIVRFYLHQQKLQAELTEVVRAMALLKPEIPSKQTANQPHAGSPPS